jgi:hypothetical protein
MFAEMGVARRRSFGFEEGRKVEMSSKNPRQRKTMLWKISFMKRSVTLVLFAFGVLLGAASAQIESVLYNFCAQGDNCTDGDNPVAGLVFDSKGNLYGTTYAGGPTKNASTIHIVASYSSSLLRARKRFSTVSVRILTVPTVKIPPQV